MTAVQAPRARRAVPVQEAASMDRCLAVDLLLAAAACGPADRWLLEEWDGCRWLATGLAVGHGERSRFLAGCAD
jgi:hypothetical protein